MNNLIYFQDTEIQNWIKDLHDNGYPSGSDGVDKGVPTSFTSRENLTHFLTMAIFTSSCQHAAVNFSQMETYSFAPNSPATLRKPPPTKKGEVTLEHIMESLPSKHLACMMIAFMYDLTRVYPTEVRLHLCCFPRYPTETKHSDDVTVEWFLKVYQTKTILCPSIRKYL